MIEFEIIKKSKKSRARLGILKTPHGIVQTPTLVAVGTQATVKTLTSEEIPDTKTQMVISNTYHLHLKPGEEVIQHAGGIHKFSNFQTPVMTDSGGFQVFSLGFGRDHGVGKILKEKTDEIIQEDKQPQNIKITEDGVYFKSYINGDSIFLGPKESIKIQEKIGADIIFAFDECTSPIADYNYTARSLEKTKKWAKICIESKKSNQALFGIVQGGKFKDLRIESSKFTSSLPFDGYGIGGEFGDEKKTMTEMLSWTIPILDEKKPRHLLGIGHPDDILPIIQEGVDTFDCIVPTHYARHGVAFTSEGKLNLKKAEFIKDTTPLDKTCTCSTCENYSRSYISHLLKAQEITGLRLITFHNLYWFHTYIESLREKIMNDEI